MNQRLVKFLILLTVTALVIPIAYVFTLEKNPPEGLFFGVSYGATTFDEAKLLIDRVKDYTNFFIVNNWDISTNDTLLTKICDYAAEAGLTFIVFFDFIDVSSHGYPWHHQWVYSGKDRWGEKFGGIYIYEEPGGKQIDTGLFDEFHNERAKIYENVTTYSEAAEVFVNELPMGLSFSFLQSINQTKFVSDYALYWFDYLAGYDTVFAELGWNHSTAKHIGLCRGAAKAQNKQWGTIITWKDLEEVPSSIKTGSEMFADMIDSYYAGANYIMIFNYPKFPEDNPYGILREEHFEAMEQFWEYASNHTEEYGRTNGDVALILPKDYGWGMRRKDDVMWFPWWGPDELTPLLWENMNKLIEKYGINLDIVYDDPKFEYSYYDQIYRWNSTIN
jgi:hypothetical protein